MANPLLDQHEWAVENLLNAPVENDAQVEALAAEHRQWRDRVVSLMEEMGVGGPDVTYFRTLGTFVFRPTEGFNEEHRRLKSIVMERCERLEHIGRKIEAE